MTALADAATDVKVGYANGPNPFAGTKEVSLYVNDQFVKKLALPDTGAWNAYATVTERLQLRAGSNDISIRYDAGDDGNVNLDYLDVTQNEPIQCPPVFEPDDEFDGAALDRCRWSTILNEDVSGYSLAGGKLQVKAMEGDIVGGTVSARNVLLQRAPSDGSWSATTKVAIDGTDDYLQAGLVAHASAADWGKLVVMRNPAGQWVLELARASGWQNSAPLPAGAQNGITLQLFASEGALRGRYSLDDGATWTEVGTGFPLTGLTSPGIGLAAYNGTGTEVGLVRALHRRRPAARSRDVHGGHARSGLHHAVRRHPGERRGLAHGRPRHDLPRRRLHAVHAGAAWACCGTARRSTTRTRSSSTGSWRATTTRACSSASPTRGPIRTSRSTVATRSRSTPPTTRTARPVRSTTSRRPMRRRAMPCSTRPASGTATSCAWRASASASTSTAR